MGAVLHVDRTVQRLTCCAESLSTGLLVQVAADGDVY